MTCSNRCCLLSGMHKPPIAPKPKLVQPQRPLLSPATLRKDGLSLPSASTQRGVKPPLPPKPSVSKLGPALDPKSFASPTVCQPLYREAQRAEGPRRDAQRENKKPDWDYTVPICLCSNENCTCNRKSAVNTHHRNGNVRPPVPHRTWSNEASGDMEPLGEPGQGVEEDVFSSEQASRPKPPSTGPTKLVPISRKLRTAGLTPQERVEEVEEETPGRDGTEIIAKEVKVILEGKSISSPSAGAPVEKQPAIVSAGKACSTPDPPPRKKPLLAVPEKTSTPAPQTLTLASQTLPNDVEEEDLGWDSSSHRMQVSVDKGGRAAEVEERDGERGQEMIYTAITASHKPHGLVKAGPKKPQQPNSPMAWTSANQSSTESQGKLRDPEERQSPADGVLKADVSRPAPLKPRQPSLSKHKSKSFSAADLLCSEGQRRNSFRKLLDLKLKMMPSLKTKTGAAPPAEQSVDGELFTYELTLPRPAFEVEQCVDGEEDLYNDYVSHYEEIADYINVEVSSAVRAALSPRTSSGGACFRPPAWQSPAYEDEGIYEVPDLYISFEKNDRPPCPTLSDCER